MKWNFVRGTLALAMGLIVSGLALADTVHGPAVVVTDTNVDFRAIGTLTTVDDANPVNGVGGTLLKVEAAANPKWSFDIGHLSGAPHYALNAQGVWEIKNVQVQTKGSGANNVGHMATPHAGEQPNALPLMTSRRQRDLEMGDRGRSLTATGVAQHNAHIDTYTLDTRVMAVQGNPNPGNRPPGPPNLLTGGFEIVAMHRALGGGSSDSEGGSFYSDPEGGTWVSFDAKSGELSFSIGKINGLDFQGGRLGGVDSAYADDPMLEAEWTVSPIKFKGMNGGKAEFVGGEVEVTDAEDRFSLEGSFASFQMGDSTSFPRLQSFGMLEKIGVERMSDSSCASPFLERWVDTNLLGQGMTKDAWARWRGIDLALVTEDNLLKETENFTVSVKRIPATVYLTLNLEPLDEEAAQEQTADDEAEEEEQKSEPKTLEEEAEGLADQVTDFLQRTFPGLRNE